MIFNWKNFTLCLVAFLLFSPVQAEGQSILKDNFGNKAFVSPQQGAVKGNCVKPSAAASTWKALGPYGGDVADVSASPTNTSIVLAGLAPTSGSGTLFRSTDSGATWIEVSALSGMHVYDIEYDSTGKAYIATMDSIYKSVDDGQTWTQQSLNIGANDQVFEVTIDPNNDNNIWVGVADAMGSQTQNVMLSTDGGITWSDKTPNMSSAMTCAGIALDPNNSNTVVAAFQGSFGGGALWVSLDGGATWTDRSFGLPGNPLNDVAHDGSRILVCGGMLFGSQDVGLYSSTNNGAAWIQVHNASWPSLAISDIEIDPNNNSNLLVASINKGVFKSTDSGATWTYSMGGLALQEVSYVPGSSTDVFAGATSNAVWKSTDGGVNFSASSEGIIQLEVESITSNPNNPDEMAIAFQGLNNGGVYTSLDAGLTWTLENLPGTRYNTVRFDHSGVLYAISDGPSSIAPEGVYRRVGGVWTCLGPDQGPYFESELYGLCFSKYSSSLIVAGGADFGVAGFKGTIWVSTDSGVTWNKNYLGPDDNDTIRDVYIVDDGTDQTMLAVFTNYGSTQMGGVLKSTDGGLTWAKSNTGLSPESQCTSLAPVSGDINSFFLSDYDYGVGKGGVYKTTDKGATWSMVGNAGRTLRVATHPNDANTLYIARWDSDKVLKSTDGGLTYTPHNSGLASAGNPADLQFPVGSTRLLFGSSTGSYSIDEALMPLTTDVSSLSGNKGGVVNFYLDAGIANSGRTYIIFSSITGSTPGTPFPGGMITVPFNWDLLTNLALNLINTPAFQNFGGKLSKSGTTQAQLNVGAPIPSAIGYTFTFAFALDLPWNYASNPVNIDIVP